MVGGGKKNLWIIANWKSNKTIAEALFWVEEVGPLLQKKENVHVVVCPTFTELEEVKKSVKVGNFPLWVGVQDLSPFPPGAYTGEESAEELKGLADLSIIGHSERRTNFGETDGMVAQKVKRAKEAGIVPLVCVQSGDTLVPQGCSLVAYEPVFAIGSGNPDTPENANLVASKIKQKYPNVQVLYGGSVTSKVVRQFIEQEAISGVLVGGASLDAKEFIKLVKAAYES